MSIMVIVFNCGPDFLFILTKSALETNALEVSMDNSKIYFFALQID